MDDPACRLVIRSEELDLHGVDLLIVDERLAFGIALKEARTPASNRRPEVVTRFCDLNLARVEGVTLQRKESAMLTTRPLFRLIGLTLTVVLALVGATTAAAAPPTSASGVYTTTSATLANPRSAGSNTIFDLTASEIWTGTFTGTSIVQGTLIFHPDGSANFHDTETFTGSVNGTSGTVTFNLAGTGTPGATPGSFVYQDTHTIIGGTGGLANLHGVLALVGTVPTTAAGPVASYTGQIHFDP
jgi:hypothetical protein